MIPETIFEGRQLSYDYEGKQMALDRVDLTVQAGKSVVILGANGCGKSTLLKMLDGLYFPTQGTLRALGHPLTEAGAA